MTGMYDKLVCQTVEPEWKNSIWEICGSMGFSDVQLPQRTVPVIKRCVSKAIKTKKTVHIYLHPWDLLVQPRLINDLDKLLDYVERRVERGDVDVMNMGQYADYLNTLGDR